MRIPAVFVMMVKLKKSEAQTDAEKSPQDTGIRRSCGEIVSNVQAIP